MLIIFFILTVINELPLVPLNSNLFIPQPYTILLVSAPILTGVVKLPVDNIQLLIDNKSFNQL